MIIRQILEFCILEDDCIGAVYYMPEHWHDAGDDLPCSASYLMII